MNPIEVKVFKKFLLCISGNFTQIPPQVTIKKTLFTTDLFTKGSITYSKPQGLILDSNFSIKSYENGWK